MKYMKYIQKSLKNSIFYMVKFYWTCFLGFPIFIIKVWLLKIIDKNKLIITTDHWGGQKKCSPLREHLIKKVSAVFFNILWKNLHARVRINLYSTDMLNGVFNSHLIFKFKSQIPHMCRKKIFKFFRVIFINLEKYFLNIIF